MDNELVHEYLSLRAVRDRAERDYQEVTERLMKQMEADQRKSYRWEENGQKRLLTYVQSRRTEIDEKGLRKALTAKVFDKYTVKKLDRKAMETAMDAGDVDPVIVSRYVQVNLSKPFLKFSEQEAE